MSYTPKECPGCGVIKPLPPKCVCRTCEDAIKGYPALAAAKSKGTPQAFHVGIRAPIPMGLYKQERAEHMAKAISVFLVQAFGVDNTAEPYAFHSQDFAYTQGGDFTCFEHADERDKDFMLFMDSDTRQAFLNLLKEFTHALRAAEFKGQKKGQDLLFQLNAGEISANDFNEKLIKGR